MSRLEDNKLWKAAIQISEEAYGFLNDLPEEEKWDMATKLRHRAVDLTTELAEAIGSIDPRDAHYQYGHAKRSIFGLKSIYILASRTGSLRIESESMVRMNELSDGLDKEIEAAAKAIPDYMKQYTAEVKK